MKRILLKLSGEALAGTSGFDDEKIKGIANQAAALIEEGYQLSIVIGGGNFWRGRTGTSVDRPKSDSIGMLATVMNCIYVSEIFRSAAGLKTRIFTPFIVGTFTELFSKDETVKALNDGAVCFFAGGTGHPYFSTDTGTVLRALEIDADMILLAKAVDGVYDSDPKKNPNAVKYEEISLQQVVDDRLQAMDLTASIMALENALPMMVFALDQDNGIVDAAHGINHGTRITV